MWESSMEGGEAGRDYLQDAGRWLGAAAARAGRELGSAGPAAVVSWAAAPVLVGPRVVPEAYNFRAASTLDNISLAACAVMTGAGLWWHGFQPVTTAAVALAAAAHAAPGGHLLSQVGLHPEWVLARGEWRRLATAPLVHNSLPHLAAAVAGLASEGAALEALVGPAETAAALVAVGAASQGLQALVTWAAAQLMWRLPWLEPLGWQYSSLSLGAAGIAAGLSAVRGYRAEEEEPEAPPAALGEGRYAAWSLLPGLAMLKGAERGFLLSPTQLLCGAAGGVAVVYARAAVRRLAGGNAGGGPRRLGWRDLGLHAAHAGVALAAILLYRRMRGG